MDSQVDLDHLISIIRRLNTPDLEKITNSIRATDTKLEPDPDTVPLSKANLSPLRIIDSEVGTALDKTLIDTGSISPFRSPIQDVHEDDAAPSPYPKQSSPEIISSSDTHKNVSPADTGTQKETETHKKPPRQKTYYSEEEKLQALRLVAEKKKFFLCIFIIDEEKW